MSEVIRKSIALLTTMKPDKKKEEWSATEISRELNIPVQTVHRLLMSLEEYGIVFQNKETKKFRIGLILLQLGMSIKDNLSVRNSALPIMKKLGDQTKGDIRLTVPEGHEGVLIECINPTGLSEGRNPIGTRAPLCVGASQKVILACMSTGIRQHIIEDLKKADKIEDFKVLEEELKVIQKCGVAIVFDKNIEKTVSVAAPIFSWEDKVVASISVVSVYTRFQIKDIISFTQKAAEEISRELGWMNSR